MKWSLWITIKLFIEWKRYLERSLDGGLMALDFPEWLQVRRTVLLRQVRGEIDTSNGSVK